MSIKRPELRNYQYEDLNRLLKIALMLRTVVSLTEAVPNDVLEAFPRNDEFFLYSSSRIDVYNATINLELYTSQSHPLQPMEIWLDKQRAPRRVRLVLKKRSAPRWLISGKRLPADRGMTDRVLRTKCLQIEANRAPRRRIIPKEPKFIID